MRLGRQQLWALFYKSTHATNQPQSFFRGDSRFITTTNLELNKHHGLTWNKVSFDKQTSIYSKCNERLFHTTTHRNALPALGPLLVKLASPISRFGAVLIGRQLRKWWKKLPEKQRLVYFDGARRRTDKIIIAIFGTAGLCFGYYNYHLEENSMTGRKQLMIMNEHQIKEISDREFKTLSETLQDNFLPVNHHSHMRVSRIAKRILDSNLCPEVANKNWKVHIIDSDMINAFVLPNGEIFVMTGMLKTVENDDELAGILGHEIAHAILNHPAEQLSFSGFMSIFNLVILASLWAIIPSDGLALIANYIESKVQDIIIHLPYQRDLEKEADCVGLYLAARACFDVRKISNFWKRMDNLEQDQVQAEWLSTHPSHSRRADWINDWMPEALEMRRANQCPELLTFYKRVRNILGINFAP